MGIMSGFLLESLHKTHIFGLTLPIILTGAHEGSQKLLWDLHKSQVGSLPGDP